MKGYIRCEGCKWNMDREDWRASGKMLYDYDVLAHARRCAECYAKDVFTLRHAELAARGFCDTCCTEAARRFSERAPKLAREANLAQAHDALCEGCVRSFIARAAETIVQNVDCCDATKARVRALLEPTELPALSQGTVRRAIAQAKGECSWCRHFEFAFAEPRTLGYIQPASRPPIFPLEAFTPENLPAISTSPTRTDWWRQITPEDLEVADVWAKKRYGRDRKKWESTHCLRCETAFRNATSNANGKSFLKELKAYSPEYDRLDGLCLQCIAWEFFSMELFDIRLFRFDHETSGVASRARVFPIHYPHTTEPALEGMCGSVILHEGEPTAQLENGRLLRILSTGLRARLKTELEYGIRWDFALDGPSEESYEDLRLLEVLEQACKVPIGTALRHRHYQIVKNAHLRQWSAAYEWEPRHSGYRVDLETRWKVLERDGFRCLYCGIGALQNPSLFLTVDHFIYNGPGVEANLAACCNLCNAGKGQLRPREEFREIIKQRLYRRANNEPPIRLDLPSLPVDVQKQIQNAIKSLTALLE